MTCRPLLSRYVRACAGAVLLLAHATLAWPQQWTSWVTIAGVDEGGGHCGVDFRYLQADAKPTSNGRMLFWYEARNRCPTVVRVEIHTDPAPVSRDQPQYEQLVLQPHKQAKSWIYTLRITGARVVDAREPKSLPAARAVTPIERGGREEPPLEVRFSPISTDAIRQIGALHLVVRMGQYSKIASPFLEFFLAGKYYERLNAVWSIAHEDWEEVGRAVMSASRSERHTVCLVAQNTASELGLGLQTDEVVRERQFWRQLARRCEE